MADSDTGYAAAIKAGLDGAFERARADEADFDPALDRIVVFSDHHKGAGDAADDFRRCEHAYTAALGWYLEQGYRLFLLGDAEELWEESPGTVCRRYPDVLKLEAEFAGRGGLVRFFGNHDDAWSHPRQVRRHLRPFFGDLSVREGLRLRVARPGGEAATLFFVHGHQGTKESDRWSFLARLPVRFVWRLVQRKTGWSATTPATRYDLRARHDRAMFEWARDRGPGVVLMAGHTHRPVFGRSLPDPPPTRSIEELEALLAQAKQDGDESAAAGLRAELEYACTARRRPDRAVSVAPPCYFNTGCCSFPDGDVTGLELADGEIRLVRWPANIRDLAAGPAGLDTDRRVLAREELAKILDLVADPKRTAQVITEHEVRPPMAEGDQ